jgi:hypothetical protein
MTWALVVWSGVAFSWFVMSALSGRGTAAGCAVDSTGLATSALTRQECIAASAGGLKLIIIPLIWLAGVAVLSYMWLETRALWRQGRGLRLHRMRAEELVFVPRPIR